MVGNENSGQRGEDRDPARTCTGNGGRCNSWPVRGATVCVAHGGRAPQVASAAAVRVAEAEVNALAVRAGLDVPADLTAKDFGPIVMTYIRTMNVLYADLTSAVYARRDAEPDALAWAREHSDILDRMATVARMVAQMMQAAGALGIRVEEDHDQDPSVTGTAKLLAALDDLRFQRDQTMIECECCKGQGYTPRWDFTTGEAI
jgi:hypothetical protein